MGNFCDKSTETPLLKFCVPCVLRLSDSSKPTSQSVSLIYEFAWLAGFHKSEENLLKTSCKVVPVAKVAHIFRWRHNRKQSASGHEQWCDFSCDIPYWKKKHIISTCWYSQCASEDNAATAELLIKQGADVNLKDSDWWTPLHVACSCDSVDMVQLLVNVSIIRRGWVTLIGGHRYMWPAHVIRLTWCNFWWM